ncbi:MAG: hypothetical protein ACPF8V_11525, partial [Luteibaculum sp.]
KQGFDIKKQLKPGEPLLIHLSATNVGLTKPNTAQIRVSSGGLILEKTSNLNQGEGFYMLLFYPEK